MTPLLEQAFALFQDFTNNCIPLLVYIKLENERPLSDLKDRDCFHLGKVVRNRGKNTGLNALRTMNLAALDNTSLADCIFFRFHQIIFCIH